jgi:hypothetical protein
MALQRSIPSQRIIAGQVIETSEIVFVSNLNYSTQGEALIVTKEIELVEINFL